MLLVEGEDGEGDDAGGGCPGGVGVGPSEGGFIGELVGGPEGEGVVVAVFGDGGAFAEDEGVAAGGEDEGFLEAEGVEVGLAGDQGTGTGGHPGPGAGVGELVGGGSVGGEFVDAQVAGDLMGSARFHDFGFEGLDARGFGEGEGLGEAAFLGEGSILIVAGVADEKEGFPPSAQASGAGDGGGLAAQPCVSIIECGDGCRGVGVGSRI